MKQRRPDVAGDLPALREAVRRAPVRFELGSSITTGSPLRHSSQDQDFPGGLPGGLGNVPHQMRERMQQIAREASDADAALAPIIELLIDGSAQKRAAIVNAFRSNTPLREQWERTYEILKA